MELKQTQQQQLKMAPMLFEAISLLQFNQNDLMTYIEEKALENPLLDVHDQIRIPMMSSRPKQGSSVSTTDVIENTLSDSFSFRDDLKQQVRLLPITPSTHNCVYEIIDSLDDKGYWKEDSEIWASDLGFTNEEVAEALAILHSLEPAGLGAATLQECLMLQVERFAHVDQVLLHSLIMEHLDHLAAESWEVLMEETHAELVDLQEAYDLIKRLSPYPVQEMEPTPTSYIIPDLSLEEDNEGWVLKLDQGVIPRLSINTNYYNELRALSKDNDVSAYIHKKWSEADWLIKGLAKREETLAQIAAVLTFVHGESFREPPEKWHPLTLKEVADELGVHESTISRAVKDKYVRTHFGMLELKHFFPKGIKRFDGKRISTGQIKKMMVDCVKAEDPIDPLSDQGLSTWFLEKQGLQLSRRVIAKYRAELNIPSSVKRKKNLIK